MANPHKYGLRFQRSIHGSETPQILTLPIASGYTPNTGEDGSGGTDCDLNVGDPVQILQDGTVRLLQPSAATTSPDADDNALGVVAGFPRVNVAGFPRPNGYYPRGTTYSGDDQQTLVQVIPAAGNIFEIDTDAAGGTSLDTKAEWQAVVGGGVANLAYSTVTIGSRVKANPLLSVTSINEATHVKQLRIVGLGKGFDQYDASLTNVPLQVMFNLQQLKVGDTGDVEA
jgi:hypothetical protein